MHADSDAVRSYGRTTADLGANIREVAAALSVVAAPSITHAFGPVGTRFAAALVEATTELANSVARVAETMTSSGVATGRAAAAYDDVEQRSRAAITLLGA